MREVRVSTQVGGVSFAAGGCLHQYDDEACRPDRTHFGCSFLQR